MTANYVVIDNFFYIRAKFAFVRLITNNLFSFVGNCNYYATGLAFYMSVIDRSQQFTMPMKQTLKGGQLRENVSRCNVCMRQYSP